MKLFLYIIGFVALSSSLKLPADVKYITTVVNKTVIDTVEIIKENNNTIIDFEIMASVPKGNPIKSRDIRYFNKGSYGWRLHPIFKTVKFHKGVDIACFINSPVTATAYGLVTKVEYSSTGYGNNVTIKSNNITTLYAHLNKIDVKPGQRIKKGQVIGLSGSTGTSSGPHLHYEVLIDGKNVDPIKYM